MAATWQISYVVLLALYSYFLTVELRPGKPTVSEILVWMWAATMWLEEIRQVGIVTRNVIVTSY